MSIQIRKAVIEDADTIYTLAVNNSLNKAKSKSMINQGFLVSNYSLEEYRNYINNGYQVYVLEDSGVIRAFLLAFSKDDIDKESLLSKKILNHSYDDYVIIKQVCVDVKCKNKGYGTKLYDFFMHQVSENIFASVVIEPYNRRSIKFHEKMGFRIIDTYIPEDDLKRVLLFWNNPNTNSHYDKEVVLFQYEQAIDLYIHEDNLNWSKINHLFYISGGLAGISTLGPAIGDDLHFYLFILVVSLIGMVSSALFFVTLYSGIEYMQTRKKAVVELEAILIQLKGTRVVSTTHGEGKTRYMKKSPTTKVMRMIPVTMLCIWILVFAAALVQVVAII